MYIKSINLLGFRNYLEANLEFISPKVIILGKNAQGKSNLLEVIQILSQLKSRRAKKDAELVNFDLDEAVIRANGSKGEDEDFDISLLIRRSGRRTLKINDVGKRPKELLHNLYSVSFMVEDLEIVNGSPSRRRDWLDSIIIQVDFNYKDYLAKFEEVLSQRNSFLKEMIEQNRFYYSELTKPQKDQMQVWDDMYLEHANVLTRARAQFIEEIQGVAYDYYQRISGTDANLILNYKGKELSQEDLDEVRARDFARGFTNVGPQRDDVEFELNTKLAGSFASQGERRTITLAIKLAELELLRMKHGEYPILLLDDVLAELDEDRQDFLLESVSEETQVIITTTHLGKHIEKWSDSSQLIEIEAGRIVNTKEFSYA